MPFCKSSGLNYAWAVVTLANEKAAQAATQVLNNAPLFGRRVEVRAFELNTFTSSTPYLHWGWAASKDSRSENVILKAHSFQRPTNIFQAVREGRRVGFDTLEAPSSFTTTILYKLLHNYNVMCVAKKILYTRKSVQRRCCIFVDFATREEADQVVQIFNGAKHEGFTLEVSKYQIPLRHLGASWDGGIKGGHRSGRDQGSAVDTNYEYVSLFVVFILAVLMGS